jgi:hypothetical protein
MAFAIMIIVAIVPIVAIVTLSSLMYRQEQLHLEAEGRAEEYIFTCRSAAQKDISNIDNHNSIPQHQRNKMTKLLSNYDDNMLYYKGRCEEKSKLFCTNSALDGYLMLRGIEDAERPTEFKSD